MYDDFEQNFQSKEKHINFYLNGNSEKMINLKLQKFSQLIKDVSKKFNINDISHIRLFNQQGVEIFEDDLEFCKDGMSIYVSKGEEFNQTSSFDEYTIIKKLGEGGFGMVMLGEHKQTKEQVALKIVNTNVIGNAQDIDMVFREAEMLKSLHHQNIVKILNCFTLQNMQVVFIMEYCGGGELLEFVETHGKLSEEQSKFFFKQIASAVHYLHREKLIHRDLKLENILLMDKETKLIKIVDFGISGVSNIQLDNADAGSLKYLAPEIFLKKKNAVSPALDIWSMGIILFGMIVGELPFNGKNQQETKDLICYNNYIIPQEIEKSLSIEIKDVLKKMLNKDNQKRISINDLMDHPFVSDSYKRYSIEESPESIKTMEVKSPKIEKNKK